MSLTEGTTPSTSSSSLSHLDWSSLLNRQRPALRRRLKAALRRSNQSPHPDWIDDLEQDVYCRLLDYEHRAPRQGIRAEGEQVRFLQLTADSAVADDLRRRFAAKRDWRSTFSLSADEAGLLKSRFVCHRPTPEQGALRRDSFRKTVVRLRDLAAGPNATDSVRALVLTAVAGWTSREVAAASAPRLPASSVETRLCRLKARLRTELRGELNARTRA